MASAMRQTPHTASMTIQYRGVRARRLMELSRARESGPLLASEENEFANWGREDLQELQFPTQLRAPGPGSPVTLTISPRTTQVKFIWDSLHRASYLYAILRRAVWRVLQDQGAPWESLSISLVQYHEDGQRIDLTELLDTSSGSVPQPTTVTQSATNSSFLPSKSSYNSRPAQAAPSQPSLPVNVASTAGRTDAHSITLRQIGGPMTHNGGLPAMSRSVPLSKATATSSSSSTAERQPSMPLISQSTTSTSSANQATRGEQGGGNVASQQPSSSSSAGTPLLFSGQSSTSQARPAIQIQDLPSSSSITRHATTPTAPRALVQVANSGSGSGSSQVSSTAPVTRRTQSTSSSSSPSSSASVSKTPPDTGSPITSKHPLPPRPPFAADTQNLSKADPTLATGMAPSTTMNTAASASSRHTPGPPSALSNSSKSNVNVTTRSTVPQAPSKPKPKPPPLVIQESSGTSPAASPNTAMATSSKGMSTPRAEVSIDTCPRVHVATEAARSPLTSRPATSGSTSTRQVAAAVPPVSTPARALKIVTPASTTSTDASKMRSSPTVLTAPSVSEESQAARARAVAAKLTGSKPTPPLTSVSSTSTLATTSSAPFPSSRPSMPPAQPPALQSSTSQSAVTDPRLAARESQLKRKLESGSSTGHGSAAPSASNQRPAKRPRPAPDTAAKSDAVRSALSPTTTIPNAPFVHVAPPAPTAPEDSREMSHSVKLSRLLEERKQDQAQLTALHQELARMRTENTELRTTLGEERDSHWRTKEAWEKDRQNGIKLEEALKEEQRKTKEAEQALMQERKSWFVLQGRFDEEKSGRLAAEGKAEEERKRKEEVQGKYDGEVRDSQKIGENLRKVSGYYDSATAKVQQLQRKLADSETSRETAQKEAEDARKGLQKAESEHAALTQNLRDRIHGLEGQIHQAGADLLDLQKAHKREAEGHERRLAEEVGEKEGLRTAQELESKRLRTVHNALRDYKREIAGPLVVPALMEAFEKISALSDEAMQTS